MQFRYLFLLITKTPVNPPKIVIPVSGIPIVTLGEKEEKSYTLKLVNNTGALKINHGSWSRLIVYFAADANQLLTLNLTTPSTNTGNIRVTQIVLPDGNTDGPFGRDMSYRLSQTGTYQLLIGETWWRLIPGREK